MKTVSIRRADPADAEGILSCLRLAFEPYRDRYTADAFADTIMSAATIQRRLEEMTVLVALTSDNEVVGTIGYATLGDAEGHLRGMAVLPNHLGAGVGQRLLETCERELGQLGCSRITLDTTLPLTRAIRFYERNGFRPSGTVRDFFGMALIEYVKNLDASPGDLGNGR